MKEWEFEQMLERELGRDFSVGTEAFRDALLERCLSVLGQGEPVRSLDERDLGSLSAAGDSIAAGYDAP